MTDQTRDAFEAWFLAYRQSTWRPFKSDPRKDMPAHWNTNCEMDCWLGWQSATAAERERCAIYATAEPTRWISVDEQLPPARVTVFMCRSHGERDMAFYDAGRYDPPWRYASDSSESIRDVIFWMHLPLPPTGTVGM